MTKNGVKNDGFHENHQKWSFFIKKTLFLTHFSINRLWSLNFTWSKTGQKTVIFMKNRPKKGYFDHPGVQNGSKNDHIFRPLLINYMT